MRRGPAVTLTKPLWRLGVYDRPMNAALFEEWVENFVGFPRPSRKASAARASRPAWRLRQLRRPAHVDADLLSPVSSPRECAREAQPQRLCALIKAGPSPCQLPYQLGGPDRGAAGWRGVTADATH